MNRIIFLVLGLMYCPVIMFSQNTDSLLTDSSKEKEIVKATFKTSRIVIGQSVESPHAGDLLFTISHHFGNISNGAYEFYGLTTSTVRLGLDYGITNRLSAAIGICTFEKNLDGCVKYKILVQSTGKHEMPITLSYFGEIDETLLKWEYPEIRNYFIYKFSYANQLLIARKFSNSLSLQLSPTFIHYNFVKRVIDQNNLFAIGGGGRFKITKRTTINIEYYYLLPGQTAKNFNNALSVGFDFETGGHVFQVFLTNSQPLFTRGFIAETSGSWAKGTISLGFNINRVFTLFE
jgi:hypothetical protein